MKILRHRLAMVDAPFDFLPTPNRGGTLEPEYLVIHYTAGRSLDDSVSWLVRKEARASAHAVIGRDGRVVQLVPFNRVAWHAGTSRWEGRVGLNRWSIGIELDNAGRLARHGSKWRSWFGEAYEDDDVLVATHKHDTEPAGWHTYTPVQLESALEVATLLVAKYGLRDVVGHDDISPGRKWDPGPAFPMESFRARLFGRREHEPTLHRSTTTLNIRTGPGTQNPTIPGGPLPPGTRVQVLNAQGSWRLVDVLDEVNGVPDLQGWVHYRFLARAEVLEPGGEEEVAAR